MQALQYTSTLKEIVKEMKADELIKFLGTAMDRVANVAISQQNKDQFAALLFSSRAGYERLMADSGPSKVLDSLKVGTIYDSARLARLMSTMSTTPHTHQIAHNSDFIEFYALLQSLSNLSKSCSQFLEEEKLEPAKSRDEILELELIDYDGTGIEPLRLERVIALLIRLHTNFARILDAKADQLKFIYFDSGSNLLIGAQCGKVILDEIRTLFSEWWDKIRHRHFDSFGKKMDAVSKGLSVLGKVKASVDAKVISEEEGNNLRVRVLEEVDQLIGLGVSLPVLDVTKSVDHQKLMTEHRDIKLLGT